MRYVPSPSISISNRGHPTCPTASAPSARRPGDCIIIVRAGYVRVRGWERRRRAGGAARACVAHRERGLFYGPNGYYKTRAGLF